MVEVGVGQEVSHRVQPVGLNIVGDCGKLFVVVGTAVDDDSLVGLIAHNIAVLLKGIDGESFDYHN